MVDASTLDRYLQGSTGKEGPLFRSRAGERLSKQHVDRYLRQLAAQANRLLPEGEKIRFSAHVLRHTFLRKVAQELARYNEDGTLRDGPAPSDPVERLRASPEVVASAE